MTQITKGFHVPNTLQIEEFVCELFPLSSWLRFSLVVQIALNNITTLWLSRFLSLHIWRMTVATLYTGARTLRIWLPLRKWIFHSRLLVYVNDEWNIGHHKKCTELTKILFTSNISKKRPKVNGLNWIYIVW